MYEVSLNNTTQFILESELYKGEPFTIQVSLPKSYDNQKKYPVVYLLDADKSIGMAKEIADWLMFGNEIQDIIIVGISYNKDDETWWINRSRDYIPTSDTVSDFGKSWPKAGGADRFLDFVQHDLKPVIEKKYSLNKESSGIIGFSFGGLLVSYSMITRPDMFDRYIIISPGLIWDNLLVSRLEEKYFISNKVLNKKIFISWFHLGILRHKKNCRKQKNCREKSDIQPPDRKLDIFKERDSLPDKIGNAEQ
jgi:predicted alpha/beta superfamily hydrolase